MLLVGWSGRLVTDRSESDKMMISPVNLSDSDTSDIAIILVSFLQEEASPSHQSSPFRLGSSPFRLRSNPLVAPLPLSRSPSFAK